MTVSNLEQGQRVGTRSKAMQAFIEGLKKEMHTNILVKVVRVDLANQRVDVQPVIYAKVRDVNSQSTVINALGEEVPVIDVALPVIQNCPIKVYRGGGARINIPIAVNDTGMLLVSERDISIWKEKGDMQPQGELRKFDLNDGVYDPFVPNAQNKDTSYATDALEIIMGNDKISMKGDGEIWFNSIGFFIHTHPAGSLEGTKDAPGDVSISGNTGAPQ